MTERFLLGAGLVVAFLTTILTISISEPVKAAAVRKQLRLPNACDIADKALLAEFDFIADCVTPNLKACPPVRGMRSAQGSGGMIDLLYRPRELTPCRPK
jgi:hypothetical protein